MRKVGSNYDIVVNTGIALEGAKTFDKIKSGQTITSDDINQLAGLGFGIKRGIQGTGKFIGKRFGTEINSKEVTKVVGKIKDKEVELIGEEAEKFVKNLLKIQRK